MRPRYILIIIISIIISMIVIAGCRGQQEEDQDTVRDAAQEELSAGQSGEAPATEDQASGSAGQETSVSGEESTEPAEGTTVQEAEEVIDIPEEITSGIEEADSLFAEGLYAEASKEYRNAQLAIEASELPGEVKQELLDVISRNYDTALNIVDTARMHHSNAMNLIYEKRYEEAEAELIAALDMYPKYQTAIDALQSLEDMKGLQ